MKLLKAVSHIFSKSPKMSTLPGTSLIFIAYPEAISRMPHLTWLWSFLFFFMLFLLGVASQFGMAEVLITAIYDQFPASRPYKAQTSLVVCSVMFLSGVIMTTKVKDD